MAKPIILTVDDDPEVLRAIERDMRRQYGSEYRVIRANSGASAIDTLKQLKLRNDAVALLLSDQRMPQMSGIDFLEQAQEYYPEAKRALLTAYADTDAAIGAINTARVDYYLMKPWDPPDQQLYPVINDLLDDWRAHFRPPFDGIRVIGHRWSAQTYQIKDFLARNQIPYQSLDIEIDPEAKHLLEMADVDQSQLPLVLFGNGTSMPAPTNIQIAEQIGLQTRAEKPFYDLLIVGGGPSGLAAAVYGASEGLRTVLVEREAPGGQAGTSSRIENYLGFPSGLSGGDLARRAVAQARRFGVEILTPQEVSNLRLDGPYRIVTLADGSEISCHALLVATGVSYRKLNVPGIDKLIGAGVYYGAAVTEAIANSGEDVYIVGGANSAGQAAIYLANYARKVVLLVRGEGLAKSMSNYLIERIEKTDNMEVWPYTNVTEVHGDQALEAITIHNSQTNEDQKVPTTGLFLFIGAQPRTDWLGDTVERDQNGFILSGNDLLQEGKRPKDWQLDRDPYLLETSIPGIFVAGDVRSGSIKRVASGVGEGSIAVQFVHRYLASI
ncbi:MAG: Thioredoxin reductase [Chloroflexi bacterium AL-W]|nr:Thioredoxin reductase [Chloroflexi bacterium AL-N1]NOK65961.1 Thioredoxin reductase [Chloroflexi bacterium AL-N10]NOK72842.1 Thioredoxin reductase [Chloroflexi bacterium AL-N5]NOK79739.1 Thioredoxin reductase [Chloroflexi bacterium AL-W]NOK88405.1 Thioredoxin reductase [Chloroflexi bacterium AL-N15]